MKKLHYANWLEQLFLNIPNNWITLPHQPVGENERVVTILPTEFKKIYSVLNQLRNILHQIDEEHEKISKDNHQPTICNKFIQQAQLFFNWYQSLEDFFIKRVTDFLRENYGIENQLFGIRKKWQLVIYQKPDRQQPIHQKISEKELEKILKNLHLFKPPGPTLPS